ncbi:hypothetical protein P6166_04750 [Stenotrophomonas sp. HITSZ_GD]|uniref:hypothetical protein n=1 Tax=Stenotrophomonas sp. HITSZ_GD TaxID=3037248 RepID=UPI00240E12D1|nr:hypothetical protein [Stenotrophomonas sp. HITSZ_GD]MDG2524667.1 hypothetical protein [Stenotrophomonas sp. HITSZ_GD]
MDGERAYAGARSRNEVIEFRGKYVIHRYCFSDHDLCDFYASGPGFRRVVFDVKPEDAQRVISELREMVDRLRTDTPSA